MVEGVLARGEHPPQDSEEEPEEEHEPDDGIDVDMLDAAEVVLDELAHGAQDKGLVTTTCAGVFCLMSVPKRCR